MERGVKTGMVRAVCGKASRRLRSSAHRGRRPHMKNTYLLPQGPANGLGMVGEPQVFLRLVPIRQGKLEASLFLIFAVE